MAFKLVPLSDFHQNLVVINENLNTEFSSCQKTQQSIFKDHKEKSRADFISLGPCLLKQGLSQPGKFIYWPEDSISKECHLPNAQEHGIGQNSHHYQALTIGLLKL